MTNTIKTTNTKNPIAKNPGYVVTTKKIKLEGLKPTEEFWYIIEITDGKNTATFFNRGESFIKLESFASGTNEHNSKFWMSKADKKLHYITGWGKNTGIKKQKEALQRFIESCLNIRIMFDNSGVMTYTA